MIKILIELTYQTIVAAIATVFAVYKGICWVLDRYHIGERRKEAKLMKDGMRNMMRELIRQAHSQCNQSGFIDEDELEHIEKVYETYHALGGNGTATRWMEEMKSLPRNQGENTLIPS